jgi:kumamolisin
MINAKHLHVAHPDELFQTTIYANPGVDWEPLAQQVIDWANAHRLTVIASHTKARTFKLSGRAADHAKATGVELHNFEDADGSVFRHYFGEPTVPFGGCVVLGLSNKKVAKPHIRLHSWMKSGAPHAVSPFQVAEAYSFPVQYTGRGQAVAILELGGGFKVPDLRAYFAKNARWMPWVYSVGVDGQKNAPTGDAGGPDGEVMLDIEIVGAIAPGANIVVYFTDNTEQGFANGILAVAHDTHYKPGILSISWGGPESGWSNAGIRAMEGALQQAKDANIPVFVASGDNGSDDGVGDGKNHVDYPASSVYSIGCGGTRIVLGGSTKIASETVWNDGQEGGATGGGYSTLFEKPEWQPGEAVKRGLPDVAGNADPQSGYNILVDGETATVGGTSAVAPLWAALFALLGEHKGLPVGSVVQTLYANPGAFHDITQGNNGAYKATEGWDATTGLGSPDGTKLLTALS